MKNKRGQMQPQLMSQSPTRPVTYPMVGQQNIPPQQSGWIKWWILVVIALVFLGGLALWVLLP